jgi:nucleotide-binding universal stress UspA family protein
MRQLHIFFATDGSASARFAQAQILALPWRRPLHVTVMTALDVPELPFSGWVPTPRRTLEDAMNELRAEMESHARDVLDKARVAFEGKAASVGTRLHEGPAGATIVEMARACRADLLAVGSRGLGPYKGLFLGSVSDYVANYARCSVLLTKTPPKGSGRYLVALDDSAHSAAVVRWLGELDLAPGSWVHLLKVFRAMEDFPLPDEDDDAMDGGLSAGKFAAWSGSREVLSALCERNLEASGARVTVEVRFGHATQEILSSIRRFGPDLLLLGAKGQHSLPNWPLGTVAQALIDSAPCSVLVVRAGAPAPAQSSFR